MLLKESVSFLLTFKTIPLVMLSTSKNVIAPWYNQDYYLVNPCQVSSITQVTSCVGVQSCIYIAQLQGDS